MLIELKEETWEHTRIPLINKRYHRGYVKEINDKLYIDLDDIYNLMDFLETDAEYAEDKTLEFSEELGKATMQEEIWEGKRQ